MAREKFPSDDVDRLMVRFPPGMRDRLKAAAEANKRSMNAEIVARLEYTLSDRDDYLAGFKGYIDEHMNSMKEAVMKGLSIVEQDRRDRIARDRIIQESLAVLRSPPPSNDEEREDQNRKLRAGLEAVKEDKTADAERSKNLSDAFGAPDFESSPSRKKMVEFEKKHGFD